MGGCKVLVERGGSRWGGTGNVRFSKKGKKVKRGGRAKRKRAEEEKAEGLSIKA